MTTLCPRQKCLYLLIFFLVAACAPETKTIVVKKEVDELPGVNEKPLCSNVQAYGSSITITGSAIFKRRGYNANGLSATVDPTDYPIRRAEIAVRNAGGSIIQCGETDNSGNFSLDVPANAATTYTVYVNSRADNSYVRVSVQNDPDNYQHYAISQTFTPDVSKSIGTITAPATGNLEGGAFNIYDRILRANEFLREKTNNCNATFTGCIPFTLAPKVFAYWKKGFNPATYFGSSSGLSFYLPGRSQLFILGGASGDISSSDTDHFDDVVILHEYGHFIEDKYASTDSPGGFHDANSIIDPRLAWGEGWATFMAVSILGDPVYRDTIGINYLNPFNNYNLETNSPSRDVASGDGEGNFREFAVTRGLLDIIDPYTFDSVTTPSSDGDSVNGDFDELWAIFAGTGHLKDSAQHFRDYGLFMSLHGNLAGATNVSSVLTAEKQKASREDYASEDTVPGGTCPNTTIQATDPDNVENGTLDNSNQHASNDFYKITHSGGTLSVSLSYTTGAPAADLDLYVYKENYTFGDTSDMVGISNASSDGGSESISKSVSAGVYLVNVNVYTGGGLGASSSYSLTVNGEQVCP